MFREKKGTRTFKKGIDIEESRSRRVETNISLRRNDREAQLASRRRVLEKDDSGDKSQLNSINNIQTDMPSESSQQLLLNLQNLGNMINSPDAIERKHGLVGIRQALSLERSPPIQQVIDLGIVPKLVEFLFPIDPKTGQSLKASNWSDPNERLWITQVINDNYEIIVEAAWAITNIASGNSLQTKCVVDLGVVEIFAEFLKLDGVNIDVLEQCVWAIGNIAGDSQDLRDRVLSTGVMERLLLLVMAPNVKLTLLRNTTWTISNLCRAKPQPRFEYIAPAIDVLVKLVSYHDSEVVADACWALSYITDEPTEKKDGERIDSVIRTNVLPQLKNLLSDESHNLVIPALRTIGNIVTGTARQTQAVIDNGAVPILLKLLDHQRKNIRKESMWALSNIAAGEPEQIQTLFETPNSFQTIVASFKHDVHEVKKEAAWVIDNILSSRPEFSGVLLDLGVLDPLIDLAGTKERTMPPVCMESIKMMCNFYYKNNDMVKLRAIIEHVPYDLLSTLSETSDRQLNNIIAELMKFRNMFLAAASQNEDFSSIKIFDF